MITMYEILKEIPSSVFCLYSYDNLVEIFFRVQLEVDGLVLSIGVVDVHLIFLVLFIAPLYTIFLFHYPQCVDPLFQFSF